MTFAVSATFVLHLGRPLSSARNRSPPLSPFLLPSFLLRPRCNRDRTNRREGPAADPGRSAAPVPWGGGPSVGCAQFAFPLLPLSFSSLLPPFFSPPPLRSSSLSLFPFLSSALGRMEGGDGVASTLSRAGIRNFF